jgi:triacylglycerol esterase/lipase EstA (alpha/beta hydrolase family)
MTIARTQRWVLALLALAALAWSVFFIVRGQALWAFVGALLILNTQPLLIAVEYLVLLPIANRGDPSPPAGVWRCVKAWAREAVAAHAVFSWRQPFFHRAEPDVLEGIASDARPVVLVHGFFCNRALWNPWLRRLRAAGVPYLAIDLEPVYGSIDEYVQVIDSAIARAAAATGRAPVIVGHSMGGIATRAWWRAQGSAADARVAHVITIGSPHRGTLTAFFATGLNAKQMRLGSPWLAQLAADEPPERYARFTCFWSHCDNISMPSTTATLPGADNRHIEGRPHVALAHEDAVFDEALRRAQAG